MATWLEDVISGLENIGGVGTLQDIYTSVRELRTQPLPQSYTAIIRRTLESNSSDSEAFNSKLDLFYSVKGIGSGIWGLRDQVENTPIAVDIDESLLPTGNSEPNKVQTTTYRVLRDTKLAIEIKHLYKNKCQICGLSIVMRDNKAYSEAHHIIPLGKHNGADTPDNIIVLCPNHHVMMDYGLITLSMNNIKLHAKHRISLKSINYHNEVIVKSKK